MRKGRGAKKGYRVHVPEHVDVKAIRTKLGMTQQWLELQPVGRDLSRRSWLYPVALRIIEIAKASRLLGPRRDFP